MVFTSSCEMHKFCVLRFSGAKVITNSEPLSLIFSIYLISIRAVLGVLLVLGVEVVDRIRHDVPRVHRFSQGRGNALHGDGSTNSVSSLAILSYVD